MVIVLLYGLMSFNTIPVALEIATNKTGFAYAWLGAGVRYDKDKNSTFAQAFPGWRRVLVPSPRLATSRQADASWCCSR